MKTIAAAITTSVLAVCVGCAEHTPGGPGVTSKQDESGATTVTVRRPVFGEAEETFNLYIATLSTRLTQGDAKTATISLSRGANFQEDVTLAFIDLPRGVSITPQVPTIKNGENQATVTFDADGDAALGEFTVKVVGHPSRGTDATSNLKLVVSRK